MNTINHYLQVALNENPNKPFMTQGDKVITFAQLDEITDVISSKLWNLGLEKGDRIGVLAPNNWEWLVTFFAATKIGLCVVPLSPRFRETELSFIISQSNIKCLISMSASADFSFVDFFKEKKLPSIHHYIFIDDVFDYGMTFTDLYQVDDEKPILSKVEDVTPDDLAIIIYTSGTTGKPKGSMITHKSILASGIAQVDHLKISSDDKMIQSLPLNHVGGITCQVIAALVAQAELVLVPEFNPAKVLELIEQHQITIFGGVPTMYLMLFNNPAIHNYRLDTLRYAIVGGSNVDGYLMQNIQKYFSSAKLICLYGLSESSGACILSKLDAPPEKLQSTLGVMIGNFEGKVVNNELEEVGYGELGELLIKGECVSKGYEDDEVNTGETFRGEWLHTGDMVTMDEEGYITFRGRKKEIYIQGGFNIFPAEVEEFLMKHPAIQMASGIGVPDSFYGEIGCYFIVKKPNETVSENEIIDYCKANLADYKVPKKIIFVDQLPMTPVGKIQKTALKDLYLAQLAQMGDGS